MEKNNEVITITDESIEKINHIFKNMEENSFHDHYHILWDLRTKLGNKPITYLEIGAYAGGSASLVSSHPFPTNVISCDLGSPIDPAVVHRNVNKFKNPKSEFVFIQGNSQHQQTIDQIKSMVKEVDILFIDGDHSDNGVKEDFKNYYPLVKEGGYIIFDDYMDEQHSPEVKGAVDFIASTAQAQFNDVFEVIGSIRYEQLKKTNIPHLLSSNEFIIRRRAAGEYPSTVTEIRSVSKAVQHKKIPKEKKKQEIKLLDNEVMAVSRQEEDMMGFPLFILEKKMERIIEKEDTQENRIKVRQLQRSINILKAVETEYQK